MAFKYKSVKVVQTLGDSETGTAAEVTDAVPRGSGFTASGPHDRVEVDLVINRIYEMHLYE